VFYEVTPENFDVALTHRYDRKEHITEINREELGALMAEAKGREDEYGILK
jgi:hypothetical protein